MTPHEYAHIPFAEHLGIRLIEQSAERARMALDRRPQLLDGWGATHGGVIMALLDHAMGAAVRGRCGAHSAVRTIDLSLGFMSAVHTGCLTIEGRVLQHGATAAFCTAEARDAQGGLLARAIGTFELRSAQAAQPATAVAV